MNEMAFLSASSRTAPMLNSVHAGGEGTGAVEVICMTLDPCDHRLR